MTSESTVVDRSAPFAQVLEVVNYYDPENLLAIGAPADEYECEVHDLSVRIRSGEPMTSDVVRTVWERWFGPGSCLSARMIDDDLEEFASRLDAVRRQFSGRPREAK